MSLSEELIAAAKSGNVKEVRKLLDRRAPFTKDQVRNLSAIMFTSTAILCIAILTHIQLCDKSNVCNN